MLSLYFASLLFNVNVFVFLTNFNDNNESQKRPRGFRRRVS